MGGCQRGRGYSHFKLWTAAVVLSVMMVGPSLGASAGRMLNATFPVVQFDDVGLGDVVDYLRNATRVNFFVDWKSLEAVGVTSKTPVTLKLHSMPMRTALTFILRSAGGTTRLAWGVDQNVIQIASGRAADLQMVRRVYPVQALLMVVPDFTDAPDFDLSALSQSNSSGNGGASGANLFGNSSQRQRQAPLTQRQRAERLIRLITDHIRPEIWKSHGGPASIDYFNGYLIVIAPEDVQEKIGGR